MRRALPWLLALLASSALAAPRIDRIQLSGNRALPTPLLEAVAAPWLGRELDEAEIEALRQALTRAYTDRGYLNSGVRLISPQTEPGVLQLRAVEGRLGGVQLRGLAGLNEAHVLARLRGEPEEALNSEQLRERFQLLLSDPLFKRVQARLLPGADPGSALLDIELERARPWQLSAFVNNHRPVSVGEGAAGLRGSVANLSGDGDQLDATVVLPLEGKQDGQQQLAWRLPMLRLGLPFTQLQLQAEHSDAAVLEEPVRQLDIRSRLTSAEIGLVHALRDTASQRLSFGASWSQRRQHSSLLGMPYSFTAGVPDGRLRSNSLKLWQEGQWRGERQALVLRSSFQFGRSNVQPVPSIPGLDDAPARRSLHWSGQLHWLHQIGNDGMRLNARLALQWARDRLLPLDGIAAGGVRSVRGFRENQLLRDEGHVFNLGLEWPWEPAAGSGWDGLRLVLEPFVDHARLRNRGQAWATLSSAGVAARASWKNCQLELAVAKRLQDADMPRSSGSLQDDGLHLQLSYSF